MTHTIWIPHAVWEGLEAILCRRQEGPILPSGKVCGCLIRLLEQAERGVSNQMAGGGMWMPNVDPWRNRP